MLLCFYYNKWGHLSLSGTPFITAKISRSVNVSKMVNENLTDKKLSSIDKDIIKRLVIKYVKDNGYIKGSYGYHNNNGTSYRGSPTVSEIWRLLDGEIDDDLLVDIPEMVEVNR